MKCLLLLITLLSSAALAQETVSFECTGSVTAMSQSNSKTPVLQAHVHGYIDAGNASQRFSGVLIATPQNNSANSPLVELDYRIKRCQGQGLMTAQSSTSNTVQITLDVTAARLWVERGALSPLKIRVSTSMGGTPDGYTLTIEGVATTMGGTPEG